MDGLLHACHLQVQLAQQGSKGKGERMENGGPLVKWGPKESKGPQG